MVDFQKKTCEKSGREANRPRLSIEIEPYVAPLSAFGSYWKAEHRIFMSATVTDDAFLVKGLKLAPETIMKPLSYPKETWSGEKMVLFAIADQRGT